MADAIFLPGMSGRGEFWDPVREQLGDWPTGAVDWPGLGGTPADPAIRGYDDLVDLVVGRLERPSVLVGQSMGGYVAALTALRAPELVSHLVLAVTSAGVDMAALGAADWRPGSPGERPARARSAPGRARGGRPGSRGTGPRGSSSPAS